MSSLFDTLKSKLYSLIRPLPSDDRFSEIAKSVLRENNISASIQVNPQTTAPRQICEITFGNGDPARCFPNIHDQTSCEMTAAKINQESGRTDARGILINGSCGASSRVINLTQP